MRRCGGWLMVVAAGSAFSFAAAGVPAPAPASASVNPTPGAVDLDDVLYEADPGWSGAA